MQPAASRSDAIRCILRCAGRPAADRLGSWAAGRRHRARRARTPLRQSRALAEPGRAAVAGPVAEPPARRRAGGIVPSRPRTRHRGDRQRDRTPVRAPARRSSLRQAGGPARRLRTGVPPSAGGAAARRGGCLQAGAPIRRRAWVATAIRGRPAGGPRTRGSEERAGRGDPQAGTGMAGSPRESPPARGHPRGQEPSAPAGVHGAGARSAHRTRAGEPFRPPALPRARIGPATSARTLRCRPAGPVRAGNGRPPRCRGICTRMPAGARVALRAEGFGLPHPTMPAGAGVDPVPGPGVRNGYQARRDRPDSGAGLRRRVRPHAGSADRPIGAAGLRRDRLEKHRRRPAPDR